MRLPNIIMHAVDSESKSVAFGWQLQIAGITLYLLRPDFGAERLDRWMMIAALLVAGKLVKEAFLESRPSEVKPNAAPAPSQP